MSLLRQFANTGDQSAFRQFVERYCGLVHQVALRRTGNKQLAEEASQNVFCAVAKKPLALTKHPERIPAWLHRTALFQASKVMRSEQSYQRRKQLRHPDQVSSTNPSPSAVWREALPHLDQALNRLSASDRTVVIQHYLEGKTFQEIAQIHQRPPGTVQKQCRRALEKLTRLLKTRGLTVSTLTLAAALTPELAKASPAPLVNAITRQSLASLGTSSLSNISLLALIKSKFAATLITIALLTSIAVQQAAIARVGSANDQLHEKLTIRSSKSTSAAHPDSPRTLANRQTSKGITLNSLEMAWASANRKGELELLKFNDFVSSLSEDELVTLIPEVIASRQVAQSHKLASALVYHLSKIDPELAVRTITQTREVSQTGEDPGVGHALYLWAQKDEVAAISWLEDLLQRGRATHKKRLPGFFHNAYTGYKAVILQHLIESHSPNIRSLLASSESPDNLVASAIRRTEPEWRLHREPPYTWIKSLARIESFLPWIREFAPKENPSVWNSSASLFNNLLTDELAYQDQNGEPDPLGKELSELILDHDSLLPNEKEILLNLYPRRRLGDYFYGLPGPTFEERQHEVRLWLEDHAPNTVSELMTSIELDLRSGLHRQINHNLNLLKAQATVADSDLIYRLQKPENQFLSPELLDRALEQAQRVTDPQQRALLVTFLNQQNIGNTSAP